MRVLIVEDDPLMAELVSALVRSLRPDAYLEVVSSVPGALDSWQSAPFELIICDWRVDGPLTGDVLVRRVRQTDQTVPVVMVTAQSSRAWVALISRLKVNEYIVKPFRPEALLERLKPYLSRSVPSDVSSREATTPDEWLGDIKGILLKLGSTHDPQQLLGTYEELIALSASELDARWREKAALTERLIRSASGLLFVTSGKGVSSLLDAIKVIGVEHAVQLAFAAQFGAEMDYSEPWMRDCFNSLEREAADVAHQAARLARMVGKDRQVVYTAGLLHNLGELAVLAALADYDRTQAAIPEADGMALIRQWGPSYGNRLRVVWRLPLALRELMGAAHRLPQGHRTQEQYLLRLAKLIASGATPPPEVGRWLRQSGLPDDLLN